MFKKFENFASCKARCFVAFRAFVRFCGMRRKGRKRFAARIVTIRTAPLFPAATVSIANQETGINRRTVTTNEFRRLCFYFPDARYIPE